MTTTTGQASIELIFHTDDEGDERVVINSVGIAEGGLVSALRDAVASIEGTMKP